MMTPGDAAPVLLWLRAELRLDDNPALAGALASGRPVLPVFVLDDLAPGHWAPGGAARWWLHHSLTALAADLAARGAPLVLRRGEARREIPRLVAETGALEVHAGSPTEPWARYQTEALGRDLAGQGRRLVLHRTRALFDPDAVRTGAGGRFSVFSPFARACHVRGLVEPPCPLPARIPSPPPPPSDRLADWGLTPRAPDWAGGLAATWRPGEAGARAALRAFLDANLADYDRRRDVPGVEATSRLSPHLAWGEISLRSVWLAAVGAGQGRGLTSFLNELLWREFSQYLLHHHPHLPEEPLRAEFARFPWRQDPAALRAWQRGRTGIPLVDAGMRELWQTGWMHNRVRMVTASYLVKHLLISWREGAAWFWDTLVDADLGSNSASWQWVAGCGADAAPYFRVFNPVLQGQKFDPDGAYVRRFVPELARLPDRFLHAPWEAPDAVLAAARVRLGVTYPRPVELPAAGRERALAAFQSLDRSLA